MTKVMKKEPEREKEGKIVPIRSTLALPQWFERFEDMLEQRFAPFAPLFPAFRWPEELVAMRVPPVDVYEEGEELVVKAELPGMKKEEIEITMMGDVLTLAGKKVKEERIERKGYHRVERTEGAFTRAVKLPVEIELEKVTAKFADGVLEVRAPKTAAAKAKSRKIEVV